MLYKTLENIKRYDTIILRKTQYFQDAPTLGADAWNIQNTLTHLIVPVVAVIDFFVMGNAIKIEKINVLYVVIPPILYAIYAGIGYVLNWQFAEEINYPYFFLNWGSKAGAFGFTGELPFMGSAWWILALLLFLIGVCYEKVFFGGGQEVVFFLMSLY